MTTPRFSLGSKALSRDRHPVTIVGLHYEDGVEFAEISYDDGFLPGPVGGRVAGTEEAPTWEHRTLDGKVVRLGGDYYRDEDWIVEKGLRPIEWGVYDLASGALIGKADYAAAEDAAALANSEVYGSLSVVRFYDPDGEGARWIVWHSLTGEWSPLEGARSVEGDAREDAMIFFGRPAKTLDVAALTSALGVLVFDPAIRAHIDPKALAQARNALGLA